MTPPIDPPDSLANITLLRAADVRAIFGGVSDMWVWRHLKDGTLPPPLIISGRRFWTRGQIAAVIEKKREIAMQGGTCK